MNNKWSLELIWWLVTAILVVLLMLPIYSSIGSQYPYYQPNIFFIVVFVTFTRYIFLLKYTFFSHLTWVKAVLVFLPIPLFFYSMDALYDFQRFLDEEGVISILGNLGSEDQYKLAKYIQYQKLFFGAGAITTLMMLPFRMVISMWRVRNRGTV